MTDKEKKMAESEEKMQIVVEIPDRQYELLQRVAKTKRGMENLSEYGELILSGIPLPKGHGKLKDINKIYDRIDALNHSEQYKGKYTGVLAILTMADTILEADTESEE